MCNLKKYFLWLIYFRNEAQKFKNLSYKTRIRELQLFNNNKINQQPFTANCQKLEASCQLLKATCKPPIIIHKKILSISKIKTLPCRPL